MLSKAFRLFVSSTFADFAAERDLLQQDVFPALEAYCAAKGDYQFHALDLRWGVNEEAQLDQRTAEICLDEVRAAKEDFPPPNFLIMIGNRYGFVPLPYAIAQDEFAAILAWLERQDRAADGLALQGVYQRDNNYLLPRGLADAAPDRDRLIGAHTLRNRADEMPELADAEAWAERETRLRAILQDAADGLVTGGMIGAADREKYFLSLTDQEIVAGIAGNTASTAANDPPAIAFIREIAAESADAPAASHRFVEHAPRLDALRKRITATLPADHVVTATAALDQDGRVEAAYLHDFAVRMEDKIKAAIEQYVAQVEAVEREPGHALASERAIHRAFAQRRREAFVGRADTVGTIARHLAEPATRPLVLHGRSGLGKSTVLARALAAAESPNGPPVVARFVGASAASSDLRALMISVIEDLAAHGVVERPYSFEQDANRFSAQIAQLLSSATRPSIVFLDALDQLQPPHDMRWLPATLPESLKLVISTLDDPDYPSDSDIYRALRDRFPPGAFVEVGPLTRQEGDELLRLLERQARRALREGQRDYLIARFADAGCSPLYLKTAFEIARSWKSRHTAGAGRCILADTAAGLIAQFFDELATVHHHEPALVAHVLGYLAAAKHGLSAKELTDILSREAGLLQAVSSERFGARTDRLPAAIWVRLNRDLSPFLAEKQVDDQPLLAFFHRQVAEVARARHYRASAAELHAGLAAYFELQASARDGRTVFAKRSLSELPFHLHGAGDVTRLDAVLMSPDWLAQKVAALGVRQAIDDFAYARTRPQRLLGQALELAAGALARDPRQLAGQLIGRMSADLADGSGEAADISSLLAAARMSVAPPALVPAWARFTAPGGPEVRRFEGHQSTIDAVACPGDGRHIFSASSDRTLRVWETATGRELRSFQHEGLHAAFSSDARYLASASSQTIVRLWEIASGRELAHLTVQADWVSALAVSPDGRTVVAGGFDGTLHIWDVASGTCRRLNTDDKSVRCAAFSPDGRRIASGHMGGSVRVWDAASGRALDRLQAHRLWIDGIAFSPDGRFLASCGDDGGDVLLWDLAGSRKLAQLDCGIKPKVLAYSPDGRRIACGTGHNNALVLWNLADGRSRRFRGHTDEVSALAFSSDGAQIVSGSEDQTLRLWDAASAESPACQAHAAMVFSLAYSPDGRSIVSGSVERTLSLWDVASGQARAFDEGARSVQALAFSPDGRYVVSAGIREVTVNAGDPILQLWDVALGRAVMSYEGHMGAIHAVAFSPDGRHIASGCEDRTVRLWEVASGRELARHAGNGEWIYALAFSGDGRQIAFGSHGATVQLWDVVSGTARAFPQRALSQGSLAFGDQGLCILSDGYTGAHESFSLQVFELWDAESGRKLARFIGPTGRIHLVALSPDRRLVVSASEDLTLRLWEVASGAELARIEIESTARCLAFSPDGTRLAAGDSVGRVHLFGIIRDDAGKAVWLQRITAAVGSIGRTDQTESPKS